MGAFKDEIDTNLARALAGELAAAWPEFPGQRFSRGLAAKLEPLELQARIELLASRLGDTLPPTFGAAADVLWSALESETFTGWMTLPCGTYVSHAGIGEPDVALPLLAGLTARWSSEGPIRSFIEAHPETTYRYLRSWATDPDEHVRRLVSEGTRPRLPWARRLQGLIADPAPNIGLLDALVDDPSEYVRRSVGNHLNDISKDHPVLAVDLARRWVGRGDGAAWAVRHGLRSLVKAGDPDALELLGLTAQVAVDLVSFELERDRVAIGDDAVFTFTVALADEDALQAEVLIDYRIHYQGARGVKAPKVFKLTRRRLERGHPQTITRRHAFRHVSIRTIRPGPHIIDLQLNGRVAGAVSVEVTER